MSLQFWNIWSAYAAYYFGRVNLSMIVPVLLATYKDLSLYNVGFVSMGFLAAYAAGQFIHGQVSERFHPFKYAAVGLVGSAIMNAALGFSAGVFWMLLILEIMDGACQSMGWSSCVRANALTTKNVDRSPTVLGTSYQFGNSLAWLVTAFVIGTFGWQYGFWTASIVMTLKAAMLWRSAPNLTLRRETVARNVRRTVNLSNILAGIALLFLNTVRFGVITWIPVYLFQEYGMAIHKVGLSVFAIPIAGILGTLAYNKIPLKKDVTSIFYSFTLGVSFVILAVAGNPVITIATLLAGGFLLYGHHVFLVTTIPSRFLKEGVVAGSTGLIDGMGYIGSIGAAILAPILVTHAQGSWHYVFYSWAATSFAISTFVALSYLVWERRKSEGKEDSVYVYGSRPIPHRSLESN